MQIMVTTLNQSASLWHDGELFCCDPKSRCMQDIGPGLLRTLWMGAAVPQKSVIQMHIEFHFYDKIQHTRIMQKYCICSDSCPLTF